MHRPENMESCSHAYSKMVCYIPKYAIAVQISNRSLQRILQQDRHFLPYKIQVVKKHDYTKQVDFCNEILQLKHQEQNFQQHLIMSDKVHFHLLGNVNK